MRDYSQEDPRRACLPQPRRRPPGWRRSHTVAATALRARATAQHGTRSSQVPCVCGNHHSRGCMRPRACALVAADSWHRAARAANGAAHRRPARGSQQVRGLRARAQGGRRQQVRPELHRPGGQHRLHGQRRRPGHGDHGHHQAARRRARQLPGRRRQRLGAAGAAPRPEAATQCHAPLYSSECAMAGAACGRRRAGHVSACRWRRPKAARSVHTAWAPVRCARSRRGRDAAARRRFSCG